jgi:hypothetical protein
VQLGIQPGDHLARVEVGKDGQVLVVEALEQHRPAMGIRAQEAYGAATTPPLQGEVLVLGLLVDVEGHLQDHWFTITGLDRHDDGAVAVHRPAVGGQLPLLEQGGQAPGQAIDPARPVGAPPGHAEHAVRKPHR